MNGKDLLEVRSDDLQPRACEFFSVLNSSLLQFQPKLLRNMETGQQKGPELYLYSYFTVLGK